MGQAGMNVIELEIRQLFEHLLRAEAIRQQVQNVNDADPHAADAGASATLFGIHGDPLQKVGHWTFIIARIAALGKDIGRAGATAIGTSLGSGPAVYWHCSPA
jgi:hypothetical protein